MIKKSSNYSAGGSKGPARPLGGVRGVPTSSPTPPPEAVQEKKDLNSYEEYSLRLKKDFVSMNKHDEPQGKNYAYTRSGR